MQSKILSNLTPAVPARPARLTFPALFYWAEVDCLVLATAQKCGVVLSAGTCGMWPTGKVLDDKSFGLVWEPTAEEPLLDHDFVRIQGTATIEFSGL